MDLSPALPFKATLHTHLFLKWILEWLKEYLLELHEQGKSSQLISVILPASPWNSV